MKLDEQITASLTCRRRALERFAAVRADHYCAPASDPEGEFFLVDVLVDILHWCDEQEISVSERLGFATAMYEQENDGFVDPE